MLLEAQFVAWTSTELNYSLVSATIPILRPFVNNLATHYGAGHGQRSDGYGTGSAGNTYNLSAGREMKDKESIPMKSLNRSENRGYERDGVNGHASTGYASGVVTGKRAIVERCDGDSSQAAHADATSVGSNDSQKMIIRKDVTWHIQHEL